MRVKCYFVGGYYDGQIKYQDSARETLRLEEKVKVIKEKRGVFSKFVGVDVLKDIEIEYLWYECPHWGVGGLDLPDSEHPVYIYVYTGKD